MACTVVHVRKAAFDVYCGRAFLEFDQSIWHNPFKIRLGCGRKCVIEEYRQHLKDSPELMAKLPELKDKVLGCWCKPKACHCDVIAEMVNAL